MAMSVLSELLGQWPEPEGWNEACRSLFLSDGKLNIDQFKFVVLENSADAQILLRLALVMATGLFQYDTKLATLETESVSLQRQLSKVEADLLQRDKEIAQLRDDLRVSNASRTQLQQHTAELNRKVQQHKSERDIIVYQMKTANQPFSQPNTPNHSLQTGPGKKESVTFDLTVDPSTPRPSTSGISNGPSVEKMKTKMVDLERTNEYLVAQINEMQGQKTSLKQRISHLEFENLELHEHLTKSTSNASSLQAEVVSMAKQLEEEQAFRKLVSAHILNMESQVTQLDSAIKETKDHKMNTKEELERSINFYSSKVTLLHSMLDTVQTERDKFMKKAQDLTRQNESKNLEIARIMGQLQMEKDYLVLQMQQTQSDIDTPRLANLNQSDDGTQTQGIKPRRSPEPIHSERGFSQASDIQTIDLRNSRMSDYAVHESLKNTDAQTTRSDGQTTEASVKPPRPGIADGSRRRTYVESDVWRITYEKLKTMEIRSQYLHRRLEAIIMKEFKEDSKSFFMLETLSDLHQKINRTFERIRAYKLSRKDVNILKDLLREKSAIRQPLDDVLMENLPSTHTLLRFVHVIRYIDEEEEKSIKVLEQIDQGISLNTTQTPPPTLIGFSRPIPPSAEGRLRTTPRSPKLTPRSRPKSCGACTRCHTAPTSDLSCSPEEFADAGAKGSSPMQSMKRLDRPDRQRKPPRPTADDFTQVDILNQKAAAALDEGRILDAFVIKEEALEFRLDASLPNLQEVVEEFVSFCNIQYKSFQEKSEDQNAHRVLSAAERWTRRDLKIAFPKRDELRSITLNNLSCFYKAKGRFSKALEYLFDALYLEEKIGKKESIVPVHINICAVASKMGRHTLALQHGLAARDLLAGDSEALRTQTQGSMEFPSLTPSIPMSARKAKSPLPPATVELIVVTLYNISAEYEHLRNPAEAKSYLRRAREIATCYLGSEHPLVAQLGPQENSATRQN